jgi:hypothetical protein
VTRRPQLPRRPRLPDGPGPAVLRRWSAVALLLRLAMLGTGAVALAVASAGRFGVVALVALVGGLGLLVGVAQPQGHGPTLVLTVAALCWAAQYGGDAPPVPATLLLAVLLAVHHQAAALAAALPVTARVDRRLLARFGTHLALVLALSGLLAVPALGLARPGGSVPLEVAGLAAAVVATAVLVAAGRRPAGR